MVADHLAGCAVYPPIAEARAGARRAPRRLDLAQHAAPLALKRRLQARLPVLPEAVPKRRVRGWVSAGSAVIAMAAAVVLFLGLRHASPAANPLVTEALADHLRVVYRDHPVDVESGGPHQVKPWFTGRLDFALPAVFGGDADFMLQGGAVGYYLDRKAAILVYKHLLHTASLAVFRADGLDFPRAEVDLGTTLAHVESVRGFEVLVWRDGELGYALVSDMSVATLTDLARRSQIRN